MSDTLNLTLLDRLLNRKETKELDPTALLLRYIMKQETKKVKKEKEEEEKKKKDGDKKKPAMPTFDLWQLIVIGPFVGFGWLFAYDLIIKAIVKAVHP